MPALGRWLAIGGQLGLDDMPVETEDDATHDSSSSGKSLPRFPRLNETIAYLE